MNGTRDTTRTLRNDRPDRRSRRIARSLALVLAVALDSVPLADAGTLAEGAGSGATAAPSGASTFMSAWRTAGWPMLAGLGLAAVLAGAATARRPRGGPDMLTLYGEPIMQATAAPDPLPVVAFDRASVGETSEPPYAPAGHDARAYLALQHVDLAIDALRRHVDGEGETTPAAWLMLLDLYRTHGREAAFNELAVRFHHRFNAQIPRWDQFPFDGAPGLEAFPRLIREISQSWGTHECRRLLDRLLYDNRGGSRSGFTLNAYNDLLALRRLSDEVIDTIELDLTEEAMLRCAFAVAEDAASPPRTDDPIRASVDSAPRAGDSDEPLAVELRAQLENDLRDDDDARTALEIEHPALAGMLSREWGNSMLAARLCTILVRGADPGRPLSPAAAAELMMLATIANDLAGCTPADTAHA